MPGEERVGSMGVRGAGGLLAAMLIFAACGVISREVREVAVRLEGFSELREAPESFRGRTVILGGEIIETRNKGDETHLVILQRPLDVSERPKLDSLSEGRFIARFPGYLDPVPFAARREVTVAGVVAGTQTEPVGETRYRYVLIDGVEVHLWTRPPYDRLYWEYYYDAWHPWYPPYPWWSGAPWYWRR
jgi:outer membrane lipoprotein